MKEKDRYLLLELILTFMLLFLVIYLLQDAVSIYRPYLIFALIGGFSFSWISKNLQTKLIRLIVTVGAFGVLVWFIYSILNSSLAYREVIILGIKGALILEIILGFNACIPSFLSYIQALSIPLFMSHPIFVRGDYNETLVLLSLGYFITWLVIFKVKFYEFFKPIEGRKIKPYRYSWTAAILFIIIVIFSWVLFFRFPLVRIKKWGFFPEGALLGEVEVEKEYYGLQDEIQKTITKLIPAFSSTEERQEVLLLLSSLIKESQYTVKVDKAELALISHLKKLGPGLEPKDMEALNFDIRNYVDKKIALNLKGVKDSISNILKSRPLDIKNRISILSRINKMLYSNSYQEVDKYKNEVKTTITNIPSMDTNVKTELKEFVEQFKELKTAQIYRRKLSSFNKGMDNLEEKSKEEFNDLSSEAEQLERPSDFKEMNGKLRELKKTAPDQQKDFIKELGEISDLKLETSVSERTRDLKEKIEASKLYQNKIEELKEGANNIRDDRDHQGLSEDFREFKEKSEREKINADGELKELLEIKTYHLAKEIKESIEDILKESALSDAQKEEFLKELEKLESDKDLDKLISDTKKLQAHIDKLQNQGFIFPEARDELIKEIDQLKDISGLQFDTRQTGLELARQTEQSDISKKLEETLERLPLNTAVKDTLKKLSQELAHADNLEKMESIVQRAEREIQALSKEEKEKIKVFKELFESMAEMKKIHIIEKAFSDIRKDAEKLREMDLKQGATIEEHLNKIRDSSTLKEFKERLGDLTKYINSLKTRPIPEEMQQQRRLWQIYIMPSGAVVPIEQSVSLRAIAVFNNIFVQEISSELAWSSSDPNVAWIDAKGTIHALSRGKTKITAKYKGKIIDGPEITVVDKLSQDIEEIKKYVQ